MRISREQIIRRMRDAGWGFQRRGKRVEIWKNTITKQRLDLPLRNHYTKTQVAMVLSKAGLTPTEIEEFLSVAVK